MTTQTCTRCNGAGGFPFPRPHLGIAGLCFECDGAGVTEVKGTIRCGSCAGRHVTAYAVKVCHALADRIARDEDGEPATCTACDEFVVVGREEFHAFCHLIDA